MKVLIIGGSGLLGMKLIEHLKKYNHDVYATFNQNLIIQDNFSYLDITHQESVYNTFKKINPDLVIHTAALTNVDECEKNQKKAFDVNVHGTINVSNAVEKIGAKIVYISTDYVFDGKKGLYSEEDKVNPINYYGVTKLNGEEVVENSCTNYLIARTSVIYGCNKNNFALWAIDKLKKSEELGIVTDQYVSPTLNTDLSEQLTVLIENGKNGIFHTAGGERITRFDFVKVIAEVFGFNERLISPLRMKDMDWIAKRGRDSSLDVSKITEIKKPFKVHEAVRLLKKDMER